MLTIFSIGVDKVHVSAKVKREARVTAGNGDPLRLPFSTRHFDTKGEFTKYISEIAGKIWDACENKKGHNSWSKYATVRDVMEDVYEVYKNAEPLDFDNMTEEDIVQRVIEITQRDTLYDRWKPYMYLKEVWGVDLIDLPAHFSKEGKEVVAKAIKSMDEVKDTAVFRRVEVYNDKDLDW